MIFAHVVPKRGLVANHGVSQLLKDIQRLGHKKMCLKSDGEAALVAIQEEVKKIRPEETLLENSPVGDSQSNGIAERAVQAISEQTRVLRASLEAKLGAKVPGSHPVTCWLIEHAAELLNKYQKGEDGRSAYQRLRGKPWTRDMVEFGEKVHFRMNQKAWPREYKLEARWGEGFWMGVKWRTGEQWIATTEGICKTSAIRRVGGHRRWDAEGLLKVKGVPWDHIQKDTEPGEVRVRFLDPALLPKPTIVQEEGTRRRRARMNREDFYKHGFSEGCQGCRSIIANGDARPHTEACRARMEEALRDTAEGRAKLLRAKERIDAEVAERGERMMARAEAGAGGHEGVGESAEQQPKRIRVAQESVVGASSSVPTPMVTQSKRAAEPAGGEHERDCKKKKASEVEMEVSLTERLMQEALQVERRRCVGHV